ncbi:hypothetical protein F4813DRAFT_323932 [Daldinia decipiens]|uniref:uncharacterized protein n=1 Tax=Daldinia decipiens TaxID=326647 RepID=UPI0020C29ED1|nr:uncharacterized protein F4813DRAFT_323932 [Daldinia decipiens]KAI1659775.1 hypothetical protein F4813DRAFT_323932 [Daldinia decipiens]
MSLSSLPPETLSLVLEFLADEDLTSLILAQRVCKRFQAIIERILFQLPLRRVWNGTNPIGVCPLLLGRFNHLFVNGKRKFSPDGGWNTGIPFRRLPWAAKRQADGAAVKAVVMQDSPYLRREASWRRLSVTFGAGPSVRSVEVVKVLTVYGGTSMEYKQLDIPHPLSKVSGDADENVDVGEEGILTMGLLYDLLASGVGHMGQITTSWQFLPGRRLGSYDDWQKLRTQNQYPDVKQIKKIFVKDHESAVLFVTGHRGCTMGKRMRTKSFDDEDKVWEPEVIGGIPIKIRPMPGTISRSVFKDV